MIAMLSSLGEVPAKQAFCFATGNTARIHGLTCGLIEPGRACDLVFLDRAQHSAGRDLPLKRRARRLAGHRHGDHRRRGARAAQPQHPAGRPRAYDHLATHAGHALPQ